MKQTYPNRQFDPLWKTAIPGSHGGLPLDDHGLNGVTATVDVVFRHPMERLLALIESSSMVVGCVAWLTNARVLRKLSACSFVQIVVQKEDFLRPELGKTPRDYCRPLYAALPCSGSTHDVTIQSRHLDYIAGAHGHEFTDAVRCVGNRSVGHVKPSLMHNKFLVFGNLVQHDGITCFESSTVWTGSLNLSSTAENNFENSVIIRSRDIAQQYIKEWAQIYTISEPLDWDSEWSAPEFGEANT
jgi:hypothetical protein